MTFDELAVHFEKWYREYKSTKTQACYTSSVSKLRKMYGGKSLQMIRLKEQVKPLTILDMRVLKRMLRLAAEWEYLDKVPVIHIPAEQKRTRFLSEAEIKELLDECYDEDLKMVMRVGMGSGLRRQNLFRLTWRQLDLDQNQIKLTVKRGKESYIPIPPQLSDMLREYREAQVARTLYVFPQNKNYAHRFRTLCRRLGLRGVSWHVLRHTYASWLAMNGVDIKTIQELLDHESIQTTQRYVHIATPHKRAAVAKLPEKIFT